MIEACFFDLDKTVIDEQGRLYDGLEAVLNPQQREFATTILTARGYPRYQEAIKDNPSLAVTPGMPAALENGGRIIDSRTGDNLFYHPLSGEERTAICEYINNAEPFRYVAFHSKTPRMKTLLWSPSPVEAERLHNAYSHNADVFTGTKSELFRTIERHDPCMVTCRTYGNKPVGLPEMLKFYTQGSTVNFVPENIDKGVAAQIIADMANLNLSSILAAGNDSNDLPVLQLEGLGQPVAVGPEMTEAMLADLPPHAVHLPSPLYLGSFILERTSLS